MALTTTGPFGNTPVPAGPIPSGIPGFNAVQGIVAHAGGGVTAATQLTSWMNEVATVASGNDSVMLPPGYAGEQVVVVNDSSNSMQVFGYSQTPGIGGDTIAVHNSTTQAASTTGVAQGSTSVAVYYCFAGELGNTVGGTATATPAKWKQSLMT